MRLPELYVWSQHNHKGSYNKEAGGFEYRHCETKGQERERETGSCYTADFRMEHRALRVSPVTSGKESACHKGEAGLISPLHQKDLLEKEVAIYSIILAWEIPWTEESGRLQAMGSQKDSETT